MPTMELQNWILKELQRLFFTLKPWLKVPPQTFQSYAMVLEGVQSEIEMTFLVNQAVRTHWPNMNWPSPADLADLLAEMPNHPQRKSQAQPDCKHCQGTGYEIVPDPTVPGTDLEECPSYTVARPCRCVGK